MQGSTKKTRIVDEINELIEVYNENIDIFKLVLPSEFIREIEEFLSRLILKYIFLGTEVDSDEVMMVSISKNLLKIILWIADYC